MRIPRMSNKNDSEMPRAGRTASVHLMPTKRALSVTTAVGRAWAGLRRLEDCLDKRRSNSCRRHRWSARHCPFPSLRFPSGSPAGYSAEFRPACCARFAVDEQYCQPIFAPTGGQSPSGFSENAMQSPRHPVPFFSSAFTRALPLASVAKVASCR